MANNQELTEEEEKWLNEQLDQNDLELDMEMFKIENELHQLENEGYHPTKGLSREEQQALESWNMPAKPQMCRFFIQGICNRGQYCMYSHDVGTAAAPPPPKPCTFFKQGNCRFGDSCRFSHQ